MKLSLLVSFSIVLTDWPVLTLNILFNLSRGSNIPSLNVYHRLDVNDLASDAASVGISNFTDVVRLIERQSSYVEINTFNHPTGILRGQISP